MANEEMIQKHLDNFLAKIAGETPVDDEPRDSTEFWLKQIAEQGGGGTEVVANPTLEGGEDDLTSVEIDGTKYAVPKVVANPILAGTEALLTALKVNGVDYKVGGGSDKYVHIIELKTTSDTGYVYRGVCILVSESSTPMDTQAAIAKWVYDNGYTDSNNTYPVSVFTFYNGDDKAYFGGGFNSSNGQSLSNFLVGIRFNGTALTYVKTNTSCDATIINDVVVKI